MKQNRVKVYVTPLERWGTHTLDHAEMFAFVRLILKIRILFGLEGYEY